MDPIFYPLAVALGVLALSRWRLRSVCRRRFVGPYPLGWGRWEVDGCVVDVGWGLTVLGAGHDAAVGVEGEGLRRAAGAIVEPVRWLRHLGSASW